jgi:ribose-phosphate pyrophosphokinase
MRQDAVFHTGEAVSQKVLGRTLESAFSALVTVDPHLHRVSSLGDVFPALQAVAVTAADLLGRLVPHGGLVVGPDGESSPLTRDIAKTAETDWLVLRKERHGDRAVELLWDGGQAAIGRDVVLVDDICSSGTTLADAARLLLQVGARSVEALVVHALHDEAAALMLRRAGIGSLRSTDSLIHPTNAATLVPVLAEALIGVMR